jgi:hypothetical protein
MDLVLCVAKPVGASTHHQDTREAGSNRTSGLAWRLLVLASLCLGVLQAGPSNVLSASWWYWYVPVPTVSTSRLVFNISGDVWMMKTDGTSLTQLTHFGDADEPRLASGVAAFRHAGQVYIMNADGSAPAAAVPNTAGVYDFDLSPDATRLAIVYLANNNFDLYTMNIDGSGLTKINGVGLHQIDPAWGRDGYIYLDQSSFGDAFSQKIYRIPETGVNNSVELTNYFSQYCSAPGPNNQIAFLYNQPAPALRTMNTDGTGQANVAGSPNGVCGRIAYDQDVNVIYYQFNNAIYSIDVATGDATPLYTGLSVCVGVNFGKTPF